MSKIIQFGEDVPGYPIRVLNEREIRAAAGLFFLATFTSLLLILFKNNFVPIKYVITIFFVDFSIRVFISPRFSPTLIIGRLVVRNQTPEYVGARQKRFAWLVGLILSAMMFVFLVLVNAYSPITGLTCLVCLIFLFSESVFGICWACKFYSLVFRRRVEYCPGEVCDVRSRHDIQKTTPWQMLVVIGLVFFIYAMSVFFDGYFAKKPHDLFGVYSTAKNK